MKRNLALLLAGLMVLSCVGCSAPAQTPTEPATDTVAEAVAPETTNDAEATLGDEAQAPETEENTEAPDEEAPVVEEEEVVAPEAYLKDVFASHNMKVGTCLTPQMISNDATKELILANFNSITMENAMKPDYIFDKEESIASGTLTVKFGNDVIQMLDFAKENDMAVRGHTLVWYSQTPDWIFYKDFDQKNGLVDRDTMLERMEGYIKQVFEQLTELGYADLFYAYDVVNEAWMEDGTMRDCKWLQTIGDDYLYQAFYFADKYAPENIHLFYNDYNEQFKTNTLFDFVNTLVDEDGNSLIDGVGFQAHLYTQDDLNAYFKTAEKIGSTGLIVELTELDVSLGAWQNTLKATDENLRDQGKYYYNLINGLFERADAGKINMDSLTFWGFADHLSWRREASPLLFDKNLDPKYSFYGSAQLKDFAGFNN